MPSVRVGFNDAGGIPVPNWLVEFGPTLAVRIGLDPAYQHDQSTRARLPDRLYPALVDTGATDSSIDSALAMDLGLPVVDRATVAGALGAGAVNVHLAQIYVPDLDCTVHGRFAGVHLAAGGQRHFALLGRTFLRNFTMTYEGRAGVVTISND
jgi:predicted aspartyl protease